MGVTGLWRLVEPSGTLVPLQTLDNKVLAVDVSIWLHQAIKGFQNAHGGTLPNAHLLGIYHRICKLLFFGIKPVVVFDGGVPHLKQQTIFQRASKRSKALSDAETIHNKLVSALLKHTAISKILSDESKATLTVKPVKERADDLYHLPPTNLDSSQSLEEEEESSTSIESSPTKNWDLHTIDEKSAQFKALPADVRHDILTDLKETRKQSSWGKIHEMPKQSDDFSVFQMNRLLKRYSVQVSLEEVKKEMGGRSLSLAELESLLKDQGVVTNDDSVGKRIASDESKRYLLIKDLKKAMDDAKKQQEILNIINEEEGEDEKSPEKLQSTESSNVAENKETLKKCDVEYENDLKLAIELSLQDVPSTSKQANPTVRKKLHELSFLHDFEKEDFHDSSESDDDFSINENINKVLASAKNYMVEYSGLTPSEIGKIISGETKSTAKAQITEVPSNTADKSKTEEIVNESLDSNPSISQPKPQVLSEIIKNDFVDTVKETQYNNLDLTKKFVDDDVEDKIEEAIKISEDDESDSSNDFVDVDENISENVEKQNTFEIVVKPDDVLEDDLFSDVFREKNLPEEVPIKKKEETISKPNLSKIRDVINVDVVLNDDKKISEDTINERKSQFSNTSEHFVKPIEESVAISEKVPSPISREQLQEMQQDLQLENIEMMKEQLSKERMANSLSEQIIQETQDLLRLFGIPFVIAPMEAEAQCAFLELIDLTDGTITDDSDIWLFGGKTVYKNFFNQQKHVLEFRADKISEHFKLSREQMILLALLVGSDYTLGLQGVGPVTALEILGAFPSPLKQIESTYNYQQLISGLIDFRKWLNGERKLGLGRQGLRSKLKNVTINESFPNLDVVRAYLEPNIDVSKEPFSWGKPNIEGLIDYAKRKFGWSREKSEGILKPVLKSLEPEVQKSITHYFKTKHKIEGIDVGNKMSKRVKKAVEQIEHGPDISEEDNEPEVKKGTKKRSKRKKKEESTISNSVLSSDEAPKSSERKRFNENKHEEHASSNVKKVVSKKPKKRKDELDVSNCGLSSDEDVQVLKISQKQTKSKINQIKREVVNQIAAVKKIPTVASLHKKEVIPQRQRDKADALRKKIKAIEIFRKSKKGPGFVQPRKRQVRLPKADAELSESSSD